MEEMGKDKFQRYLLLTILLLLSILIFWSFTFGSSSASTIKPPHTSFPSHNLWNYFLPQYQYCFERLGQGELPLWNPYQACGLPSMATLQPGIFYPPNWLYCIVDVRTGLKWLSIFHLLWAGVWIGLLYRELFPDSDALGPVLASAGFVFSGFLQYQVLFPGNLYAASWLPCVLFFGVRLVQRRSWGWAVSLAIAVALAFLAGFTQFTIYIYLVLCGLMLLRMSQTYLVSRRWRELLTVLLLSAAAVVIALLFVSPQLLPTMELVDISERRPGALDITVSHVWGPEPYTFKGMLQGVFSFSALHRVDYIIFYMMIGSVLSFLDRKNRVLICFFASAGIIALLLSLGSNAFLYPFYFNYIPTGNWFTGPDRWRLIFLFCICILGARGTNLLADEFSHHMFIKKPRINDVRLSLCIGVGLLTLGCLYSGVFTSYKLDGPKVLIGPLIFFPFLFVGLIAGIFLVHRKYLSATAVKFCLISVIFAEALFAHRYMEPFPTRANIPYNMAAASFLREKAGTQRVHLENHRMRARVFPEKAGSIFKFYATTDWEPLSLHRFQRFVDTMKGNPLPFGGQYGHFQLMSLFRDYKVKVLSSLFNLLSPKYVVISDDAPDVFQFPKWRDPFIWSEAFPEVRFPLVAEFDGVKIYENPSALPRGIFSPGFVVCEDDSLALELISAPTFDPKANPIVDATPELHVDMADKPQQNTESNVEIELLDDERIRCKVDARTSGILWTTDAHYPGWKVKVNGEEARLLRVNYLFRGVALPSGIHNVEFYYECRPLRLGVVLFVSAILIIVLGFIIKKKTPGSGTLQQS